MVKIPEKIRKILELYEIMETPDRLRKNEPEQKKIRIKDLIAAYNKMKNKN